MRRDKWYNWPASEDNLLVPWYVVTRRLVVMPLYFTGLILSLVAVVLGYGLHDARRFLRDNT